MMVAVDSALGTERAAGGTVEVVFNEYYERNRAQSLKLQQFMSTNYDRIPHGRKA